ncbi:hypothetical protein DYB35_010145 [Aphanomyces astaci]|uniref:WRKY19-like zinc finger domain-containing protein n=1 Tax=Aphanomyces astaci TaxID=112090 RepID=A0A418DSA1_APHAT|nr:hypothetical protein DYB35_010145 [Aphanomyces astaci]
MTLRSLVSGNDANLTNELNRGQSLETMLQLSGYNAATSGSGQTNSAMKPEGHSNAAAAPSYSRFNARDSAEKLKRLLSSGSFSTMQKKASVSALLGLLETQQGGGAISRADANELLRNLGSDYTEDELKQLSGQNMFRSFIHTPGQTMDRKKSFDVIQGILNSCSNSAIHKPMTSQDSFRFQNLANCLDTIEGAVAKYEEDGGDEDEHVVAVDDNLDNLLDDPSPAPPAASVSNSSHPPNNAGPATQYTRNAAVSQQQQQHLQHLHHQQQQHQHQQHNHQLLQQQSHQASQPGQQQQSNYATHTMYQQPQAPAPPVYGYGYAVGQPSHNAAPSAAAAAPASSRGVDPYQQEPAGVDNTQYAKFCMSPGCSNIARTKGMCKVHGGGRRCKVDGCMKSAQTGHLCIAHGGGKPCRMDGCPKTAQSRGLCKQHGGGVRCKFDGCTKSCQSGGYCRGHGGGKRCEFAQCKKWAQRNGFCAKHAQEMTT